MGMTRGFVQWAGLLAGLALCIVAPAPVAAQASSEDFATGSAAAAWASWQPAMQAVLDRNADRAEQLFGELLATNPSPFRIALLADRTVSRTALGGALLLLEQDKENKALRGSSERIATLLEQGREQMNQADDAWYFCSIGRFDVAQANFRALLGADPDPVALVEFTDQNARRRDTLLQLSDNATVGESARTLLRLLDRGEELIKADPLRIKTRIERLDGPPRAFENSVALLKQSGEYAIPFLIQSLRDATQKHLTQSILRCLPQIDRPGVNPLVVALRMDDRVTQCYLVEAVGKIGYPQALPYLLQLKEQSGAPTELLSAVEEALGRLRERTVDLDTSLPAAEAFFRLASDYYRDTPSLAADPRLDTANVWYWKDDLLQNIPVPTQIFNEVMCLRCCEEALRLDPQMKKAQALWVAASFRREAQLRPGQVDATRPENYPSAAYFAQTSGPAVCLLALARAVDDGDPVVALGTIEALHNIAGPASVVGDTAGRLPLAEALSFPDRMVRIRAALTLGQARPVQPFHNCQNLMPVLAEALTLIGGARSAYVADPDAAYGNAIAATLRDAGFEVVTDTEFLRGLQKVRQEFSSLDVIFLSSRLPDLSLAEALRQLRDEFRFAATPVIIINKPGDHELVANLVRADHRLEEIVPGAPAERVRSVVQTVGHAVGITAVTPEVGTAIALEAAETLRMLAVTNNPLFHVMDARAALLVAFGSSNPELRLSVAATLGHLPDKEAQEAIAKVALDSSVPEEMRVKMFAATAEAAKHCGNLLGTELVGRIVSMAESEPNLVLRTAASQTLGALNLKADKGSEIIRNQYGG